MGHDPQDTRQLTLLDISEELRSFFLPTQVRIYSPFSIEPALLQPFLTQTQPVLLTDLHNRCHTAATVESLHDTFLIINLPPDTSLHPQEHDELLVTFPLSRRRHFVLKTRVDHVFLDNCILNYQDLRVDPRWTFPWPVPVDLVLASPLLLAAIRHTRIMREITLACTDNPERLSHITDKVYEGHAHAPSPCMQNVATPPPLLCALHDLSLGGMGLLLTSPAPTEDELVHHLVQLRLQLPYITVTPTGVHQHKLALNLLGTIRHCRISALTQTLHIEFLGRLPDLLTSHLASVAHNALAWQQPAALSLTLPVGDHAS